MELTTTPPKIYALLGAPAHSGEAIIIQLSFNRKELELMKAAIEAQTTYFTPRMKIREMDDHVSEWYWPQKVYPNY